MLVAHPLSSYHRQVVVRRCGGMWAWRGQWKEAKCSRYTLYGSLGIKEHLANTSALHDMPPRALCFNGRRVSKERGTFAVRC